MFVVVIKREEDPHKFGRRWFAYGKSNDGETFCRGYRTLLDARKHNAEHKIVEISRGKSVLKLIEGCEFYERKSKEPNDVRSDSSIAR